MLIVTEGESITIKLNEELKERTLKLCRDIAGSRQIVATCFYGPWACRYANENTDLNVLLILENFSLRFNTYSKTLDDVNLSILTINRLDFERDVKMGLLGEFFSEKLIDPYEPLENREYLRSREVKTKKRIVLELLENLILEFPESSYEFLIKKEYFMFEVMMRRNKLLPSLIYRFLNMSRKKIRKQNMEAIMDGYIEALYELEKEKIIYPSNGYYQITQNHISVVKRRQLRLPIFLKSIQRMALSHILSVYSKTFSSLIQDQRIFIDNNQKVNSNGLVSRLEDPKKYLFLPTPLGLVSISEKSEIEDVVRKIFPNGELSKIVINNFGGVLNDVYLLTLTKNGGEQKIVVKQFRDWSNLKWLPLTLWSLGTISFAVNWKSRLEKEYAINKFLHSKGFAVPKIFYISPKKRMIFEEFIEGEKLVEIIKRIFSSKKTEEDIALVKEVGCKIAEVHGLGVSLGDCKPENFIISKNEIFHCHCIRCQCNIHFCYLSIHTKSEKRFGKSENTFTEYRRGKNGFADWKKFD